MSMMRQATGGWASQRGASVAQSAAVALAAAVFIGAILLVVPQLGTQVDTSFKCLIGVLSGGGADCAAGGTSTADAPADDGAPKTFEELGGEDCDATCQIIGFLKGFGEGFWDMLKGLASMAKDLFLLITGDEETWAKYKQLIEAFLADPAGVAKALLGELAAPIIEDWEAGRYGEATGRLLYEVISTIGGTKGLDKLAKLGKLGKTADNVGDAADVGKKLDNLPGCTVQAPTGKAPGLAKPLAGCWGDRFANASPDVKKGIQALENRMEAARKAGQHAFANGLEAQLKRAWELQKQGKLKDVEVISNNGRYDFVLDTGEVVEFKYWSNDYTNSNIAKLADQVEKYSNSGQPVILELARTKSKPVTPEVVNKLKQELADRGITNVTINIIDVAEP